MDINKYDHLIKVLLVGDSGSGKSSLILRYDENKFTSNFMHTLGIDFKIKMINLDNKIIKLQIWDTAGQERYKTITKSFFRGSMAIILVYDTTNPTSFDNIRSWLLLIENNISNNVILVLVGSKTDLENQKIITTEMGQALADEYNMKFYETSSKSGLNVNELFIETTHSAYEKFIKNGNQFKNNTSVKLVQTPQSDNSDLGKSNDGCC